MEIRQVKCKTALSKSLLPGLNYSLNPYRGCQHSCAYCYVPNILRIDRNKWGSFVDARLNIPLVLSKELKKKKPGTIGISTVTDPYQPIEDKLKLTRYCLEQLLKYNFPVCIQTKSKLILRDIDIISKLYDVEIMFSIGTLDDNERKILEPNASSISDRLNAMKKFSDEKIKTTVFFGPVYPTIKVEDLEKIIDTFVENGAKEIMVDKFNLKPGIFQILEKKFPDNIDSIKNTFYFKQIFEEIKRICNKKNVKAISAF
ncbi:MAG: radical SAM protein [Thermoplasmatota archaeon]